MSRNLKIWRESASLVIAAKSAFAQTSSFNYKVLCLKRSSKSKFMPDTYVFPGGNIESSDKTLEWFKLYENFGFTKESFLNLRPTENVPKILEIQEENQLPKDLSFRICAIRETFEECGILLCKSPKTSPDINSKWASFYGGYDLVKWQHRVHDNAEEFLNLCSQLEIYPDVWSLKNWSNWITPPSLPVRFNAVFFLATLSQMPGVNSDQKEIQDLMWTTPDQCISLNAQEKVSLPPPQFYELARLKNVSDVDALANFAHERSRNGCESFWPYRICTDEGQYTILPGDDLYPDQIDKDNTEIKYFDQLPHSKTIHRLFHGSSAFGNRIQMSNYEPRCGHLLPHQDSKL